MREARAGEILKKIGNYPFEVVLDPTMLIDQAGWRKIGKKHKKKEAYLLLVLLYNEDNGATQIAKKIAGALGLKVKQIVWNPKKRPGVDSLAFLKSPQAFIGLIDGADYIVTNSFHGIAFSIGFNKEFYAVPRSDYNTRLFSLLGQFGLKERIRPAAFCLKTALQKIDYERVNRILEEKRGQSVAYIKRSLNISGDDSS